MNIKHSELLESIFFLVTKRNLLKFAIVLPLFLTGFFQEPSYSRDKSSKKKDNIEKNIIGASKTDTFLYRQIGVNYLCRARLADIEFPKALGVSSATFADIISQKHGGLVQEIPDQKLTPKQLYMSAEVQIVEGAMRVCPNEIPEDTKKKFQDFLKKSKSKK